MSNQGFEIGIDESLKIDGDATKLFESLALAQAEFQAVPKNNDGQAGFSKFKYAGYATIMRCVRPALSKHGITILQPLHYRNEMAVTTTILAGHGASIRTSFCFPADYTKKQKDGSMAPDPQEFGRNHTYYRRYQLQSMLGIEGDADADDLPDVNEKREAQTYTEPKTVKAAAPAPKALPAASAETKPAPAPETKPEPSAASSEVTTTPKPAAKVDTRPLNNKLQDAMEQLEWKMSDMIAFYVEHVDPKGFTKAKELTEPRKQKLYDKMVELHADKLAPF